MILYVLPDLTEANRLACNVWLVEYTRMETEFEADLNCAGGCIGEQDFVKMGFEE